MPTYLGLKQCEQLSKMLPNPEALGCKQWLKLLCSKFQHFCHELHQFFANGSVRPSDSIHETISLSCCEIVDCIYWLQQTAQQEILEQRLLSTCRSHFSARIQRCLRTLLNAIDSHRQQSQLTAADAADQPQPHFQMNLVDSMDFALDLLQPLTMFADTSPQPLPPARCALLLTASIHSMLANVRHFARHCREPTDRRALLTLAATVRRQCSQLVAAMTMVAISPPQLSELRATALESTLYQLDTLLNEALLRLICHVFRQADAGHPAGGTLATLWRLNANVDAAETAEDSARAVASLRLFAGRLQQIGHIAALFSSQPQQRIRLRTSLAAIEELVLASVLTEADGRLLQRHWMRAIGQLQQTVFRCVDTQAFCGNLLDQLCAEIERQQRWANAAEAAGADGQCRAAVLRCLGHCAVLQRHFAVNGAEFGEPQPGDLEVDSSESTQKAAVFGERRRLRDDFALMVAECRAAAAEVGPHEWRRVVKRLRVLHSVLRRLRAKMQGAGDEEEDGDGVFGSNLTATVLGKEAVPKDCSLATVNGTAGTQKRAASAIRAAKPLSRKSSMRTAMFKRLQPGEELSKSGCSVEQQQQSLSVDSDDDDVGSQSFDCNITDILAQLAEVSSTL